MLYLRILQRIQKCCVVLFRMQTSSSNKKVTSSENSEDTHDLVFVDKIPYTVVTEGKAEVLFPSSHDVFYNPVQEFNRDLSIAILKQFIKEKDNSSSSQKSNIRHSSKNDTEDKNSPAEQRIRVLEALAASGLRSIRFAKEIDMPIKVIANDRDQQAYSSIRRNIKHNNVEDIVEACNEDASLLMYQNRKFKDRFDVIDLDPYGTAAPFLDSAVQSVADGGLLMVTCTDMAILCGNGVEACHAKYGAVSFKSNNCHEMALRIVLQSIESHANRYGRYIEPLLSLSVDFYVRLFVRIYTSPIQVKQSICKLAMVYFCQGCGSFELQPLGNKSKTDKGGDKFSPGTGPPVNLHCAFCNNTHKICGPIWSANLHNHEFIQNTLQSVDQEQNLYNTSKRILGMLSVVLEELEDCPLHYRIERLASFLHVISPTNIQFRSALLNAGYKVSISHTVPTSIKTNAPPSVIWAIMKAWATENPGKKTFEDESSRNIMSIPSQIEVSFKTHEDADPKSRTKHLLRFQVNPTRYWGPKCRATTSLLKNKEEEKRLKGQNKRQKKENESEETANKRSKGEDQIIANDTI